MKALKIMTLLLMILVLSLGAQAQLQISDVKLGSDNQDRGMTTSVTVTVKNIGDQDIDDLTVSFPGVEGEYDVQGSFSSTSVEKNETVDLTVEGFVPLDLDAVDSRGRKITLDIGDLLVRGNYTDDTPVSEQVNLLMEAENKLEFGSGTEVEVDGDSEDIDDGDEINDVQRGSELLFTIEVENNFDDDGDCEIDGEDCDIDDIEVVIESRDSEFDLDEEIDFDNLNARDEDSDSFTFTVDDDVDDDDYDIDMWMTGRDENGARHGQNWEFTIEVEVPREEVSISSFDMFPSTLECDETRTELTVTLKNTGRNDLNDASIFVNSAQLDIKDSIYNIEIDEGDRESRTFNLRVPSDTEPGQYFIQIIANVDHSDETDRDAARLVVEECVQPDPDEDDSEDVDNIDVIEVPPTGGVIIGEGKQPTNFFDSNAYILLLGVLVLIMLLLIFVLLAVLLK